MLFRPTFITLQVERCNVLVMGNNTTTNPLYNVMTQYLSLGRSMLKLHCILCVFDYCLSHGEPKFNTWVHHNCLNGIHYDSQGKILTNNTNNKIPYTIISYNIPSNINKQTNNNIMQDHASEGYTFGHLSLIQSLALDIPSGVATVRDWKNQASKKRERFLGVLFKAPLFLG